MSIRAGGRGPLALIKLVVLIFFAALGANKVAAQDAGPAIEESVTYSFGQELRFALTVEGAAPVQRLTLYVRPGLSTKRYEVDVPFTPGQTISVTHAVDVAFLEIQPYSQIYYTWQIETATGSLGSQERSFRYEDDRFAWQQMPRQGVIVHWTGNGPFLGQTVLDVVDEAFNRLAAVLPLEQIVPFDVYVYPSAADLRSGLRLAGLDGETTSHPELDVILTTAVNPQSAAGDLGQTVPYELAHLLLYRVTGERYEQLPWWLAEGLALHAQARPNPQHAQALAEAVKTGNTLPVAEICRPLGEVSDPLLLASAQSASLIDFILSRYGQERLVDLVAAYVRGDDCERGIRRALDLSLVELEEAWKTSQLPPSGVSRFLVNYGVWLLIFLGGLALVLLVVRVSGNTRKKG